MVKKEYIVEDKIGEDYTPLYKAAGMTIHEEAQNERGLGQRESGGAQGKAPVGAGVHQGDGGRGVQIPQNEPTGPGIQGQPSEQYLRYDED